MTQIKPKTNRTIVATHCFCCCSLRLQEYRRTHSPAPPLFVLPLKQSADTSALSARFDRIFALSNSVFHVKHRFFYCFSVGILLFLLLRILLVFFALFCFVELSGVFGCDVSICVCVTSLCVPGRRVRKLVRTINPLFGETDRRTFCCDDISIFGALIGERFAFLCGVEQRLGLGATIRFNCPNTGGGCWVCPAVCAHRNVLFCL